MPGDERGGCQRDGCGKRRCDPLALTQSLTQVTEHGAPCGLLQNRQKGGRGLGATSKLGALGIGVRVVRRSSFADRVRGGKLAHWLTDSLAGSAGALCLQAAA
jgi:hypothetical protein